MKRLSLSLISLSVVLLLIGMTPVAWAGAEEEVRQVISERRKAFLEGNAEALGTFYAEDAQRFSSENPFRVDGREAIQASYAGLFRAFPTILLSTNHLSIRTYNGTTAISSGYYTVTLINKKGKARRVRGRFTHILAKVDGRWLIVSQHTSALPGS